MAEDRKVLIADSDQKSAVHLVDALREKGISVLFALDGPKALELAISDAPHVIILDTGISMIEFDKLAAILRANPKTENIPIVFVSPERSDVIAIQGYQDSFLSKPVRIDEALARVESIFGKENTVREVSAMSNEIAGNLSQIPLVDLLQVLYMNKKEGIILLDRQGEKGYIDLLEGNIINARVGKIEGEKALFRLFGWREGKFEFSLQKVQSLSKIKGTPDSLLMEGMRQLDEWERFKDKFPGPSSSLKVKVNLASLPKGLRPITQEILLLLEFYSQVRDIVDNCPYPDYECYLTLQSLLEKGIIEEIKPEKKDKTAIRRDISTPEKLLKLKEIVSVPGRSKLAQEYLRVTVYSPSLRLIKEFFARLHAVPGLMIEGAFFNGHEGGEFTPFGIIARVSLSETMELHFLSMPVKEQFLPLWRAFSIRSLGGILLCDRSSRGLLRDFHSIKTFIREQRNKGLMYVFLPDNETDEIQEFRLRETMELGKEEAVFMLSRENEESAFLMLTKLLDIALS